MLGLEPLTPAYGRDYRSLRAAQADLDAGRDFQTPAGPYVGIEELRRIGVRSIGLRYGRLRKYGVLRVKAAEGGAS